MVNSRSNGITKSWLTSPVSSFRLNENIYMPLESTVMFLLVRLSNLSKAGVLSFVDHMSEMADLLTVEKACIRIISVLNIVGPKPTENQVF